MITTHTENRFIDRHASMFHYGATAVTIGTVASLAISAAGTGLSMYAQNQQAQNAEATTDYNYKIAQMNAEINANAAKTQAANRAQAAQNQHQTQLNNAALLEAQGRGVEAQAREKARRMQEESDAQKALIRSRYAKSGVTSEGSPLMVMAKNAALLELAVQDGSYQAEMEARALDRRAGLERAGSEFSLFDKYIADYEAAAAQTGYALDLNAASASRAAGLSEAQGYRTAMYGTLISSVGDSVSTGYAGYKNYTDMRALSQTQPNGPYNPYAKVRKAKPAR